MIICAVARCQVYHQWLLATPQPGAAMALGQISIAQISKHIEQQITSNNHEHSTLTYNNATNQQTMAHGAREYPPAASSF